MSERVNAISEHDFHHADIAVIGAGAAGLMAAIAAGRAAQAHQQPLSILALDGAKKLGAKILVAGGGRCNVTHHAVDESAYAGSSRNAIKKVLRSFPVERTIAFFAERGVELKREETGKLFPTTDSAQTVLDALLTAARDAGVQLVHPWRVASVSRGEENEKAWKQSPQAQPVGSESSLHQASDTFIIHPDDPSLQPIIARRVILATGGRSLPKTGSDGHGYEIARSLGHTITPRVFPALVPLTLDKNDPRGAALTSLSGLTLPATLDVRSATGKRLASFTNSTLLTHFGLSGPGVLDISRYYTDAKLDDPAAALLINFLPSFTAQSLDALMLNHAAWSPVRILREADPSAPLPERLARVLCELAGVDPSRPARELSREQRKHLVRTVCELPLPVTGDRGYLFAEVTAGGVPLSEIHLDRMESRLCPGLFLCGELCDVDGRIGGFNFQWAWASGNLAGTSAARSLRE